MDGHLYLEKQVIKADRRHMVYHAKLRQFTEELKTLIGKWVSCEHKLAQ